MPESIAPAFVQFTYSSPKSIHTSRVPTRAWTPPDGTFDHGSYPRWSDDVLIDADTMITALAAKMAQCLPDTHSIINYTIYTVPAPGEDPQPRLTETLGVAGTETTPGWWEAVQATLNFRDTDFESMKLVLLDCDSENLFGKLVAVSSVVRWDELADQITLNTNAWSSRNGFRPATALSVTRTLNEKLRRAYGHTG